MEPNPSHHSTAARPTSLLEPEPWLDSLLRIKQAIELEGLTIADFINLASQKSDWGSTGAPREATRIEKTVDIYNFIVKKNMTVLRFLHTLLKPNHVQLRPYRTEWLANDDAKRGRIIILLNMIKGIVYTSGNADNVWKLYIYRELEELEIYAPPPSPDNVPPPGSDEDELLADLLSE
ncbi:uncharacterized protein MELLADRAFT_88115 [Melampsora larici-populina 98AG31]|uniref:Uncharacterized protein n=1 Tax=Melampsora larici-populina (strain 98AG31 / pathotype 3-4-7) TaxID=747676 RepID=F4SE33_MELLP|nr:uncharacterized protein MELLADRAFT_88115 [Melampsora larici-populina 98AG31]EGF97093.1 hypothetical protein MELLADRAFT_88115 [Melampsora larici-populina 98AG31]